MKEEFAKMIVTKMDIARMDNVTANLVIEENYAKKNTVMKLVSQMVSATKI